MIKVTRQDLQKLYENTIRVATIQSPHLDTDTVNGIMVFEDGKISVHSTVYDSTQPTTEWHAVNPYDLNRSSQKLDVEYNFLISRRKEVRNTIEYNRSMLDEIDNQLNKRGA